MPTQYDTIQAPYDYIRTKSIALIERENVQAAIEPYIKNARVLELACGSGFYTYHFLKWGARSVVGVDISPIMIDEARRQGTTIPDLPQPPPVDFILADCSTPTRYTDEPFDLVFGAWLLNYAPDRPSLKNMYLNIALNLAPHGHLISVTVPPTNDPHSSIAAELAARPAPDGSGCLVYSVLSDVEEGVFFRVYGDTPVGIVDFSCWHLRKEVYEQEAREAGLKGEVQWRVTKVPERYLRGEGEGGASLRELRSYAEVPNYGVLVIGKEG